MKITHQGFSYELRSHTAEELLYLYHNALIEGGNPAFVQTLIQEWVFREGVSRDLIPEVLRAYDQYLAREARLKI